MAGGSNGSAGSSAAFYQLLMDRTKTNGQVVVLYVIVLCIFMVLSIAYYFGRLLCAKSGVRQKWPAVAKAVTIITRPAGKLLTKSLNPFPSTGHALGVLAYLALNLVATFVYFDNATFSVHGNVAARTGWLATINMAFTVFLALKNTPLSFVTGWSHERLNFLHRIAGYATVIHTIIHAAAYASYFAHMNNLARLLVREEIYGMVAGLAFFVLAAAGVLLRRRCYELFYFLHVSFWLVALVFTVLHQPEPEKKIFIIACVSAAIWFSDRIVRIAKLVLYSINNTATLYPLGNGAGTRIVLRKCPPRARPGQHCFLWIPRLRMLETHPFTLVSTSPGEFIISARDGFTRDLACFAAKNPGIELRASVEGPYGKCPDAAQYDRVVLMAGGSGASFAIGQAFNVLSSLEEREREGAEVPKRKVELLWMVRNHARASWYADHVAALQTHPTVGVSVHITRPDSTARAPLPGLRGRSLTMSTLAPSEVGDGADVSPPIESEKALEHKLEETAANTAGVRVPSAFPLQPTPARLRRLETLSIMVEVPDSEKADIPMVRTVDSASPTSMSAAGFASSELPAPPVSPTSQYSTKPLFHTDGRPDVAALVQDSVTNSGMSADQQVLVMACGPPGLMNAVRDATAACISLDGPSVELHCEYFGM